MGNKKPQQTSIYDVLYDDDRELSNREYANLRKKQSGGYVNVNFFRRNMFNAAARGERIQYKKPKIIWENENITYAISHSLHQKHADVLSLIHSDNIHVSKPDAYGGYAITISLYRIAKAMGYKYPHGATEKIKNFINDLRWTDFIEKRSDGSVHRFTIFDDAYIDNKNDMFVITIKPKSAKLLAHTTAIKMSRKLTHKVVSIPDKLVKIKAMVRYITSNKSLRNGYTLEHLFDKLDVGKKGSERAASNQKSLFRKQLKDNIALIEEFNIIYSREEDKVYYHEQMADIDFELPALPQKHIVSLVSGLEEDEASCIEGRCLLVNDEMLQVARVIPAGNNKFDIECIRLSNRSIARIKSIELHELDRFFVECEDGA